MLSVAHLGAGQLCHSIVNLQLIMVLEKHTAGLNARTRKENKRNFTATGVVKLVTH